MAYLELLAVSAFDVFETRRKNFLAQAAENQTQSRREVL